MHQQDLEWSGDAEPENDWAIRLGMAVVIPIVAFSLFAPLIIR